MSTIPRVGGAALGLAVGAAVRLLLGTPAAAARRQPGLAREGTV